MKKYICYCFIFVVFSLMPINIFALEYTSSLSGGDTFYTKHERLDPKARIPLHIDVSNIRNISHFELYVKYDNDLIGIAYCNYVNFIGEGCSIFRNDGNIEVRYIYNGEEWQNQIDEYPIYTVTFMPIETTPSTGNTTVSVYFKNAKDKEGNEINILPSSKIFKFEAYDADRNTLILEELKKYRNNKKDDITGEKKNKKKNEVILNNDNDKSERVINSDNNKPNEENKLNSSKNDKSKNITDNSNIEEKDKIETKGNNKNNSELIKNGVFEDQNNEKDIIVNNNENKSNVNFMRIIVYLCIAIIIIAIFLMIF